jgi:hypothetical protein
MLEFESTFEEPRPKVEIVAVYDQRGGRILSMHQFVGDGTGLFGPEGKGERERIALDTVNQQHEKPVETELGVMHVPPDFRFESESLYRVDPRARKLVTYLSSAEIAERRRARRPGGS